MSRFTVSFWRHAYTTGVLGRENPLAKQVLARLMERTSELFVSIEIAWVPWNIMLTSIAAAVLLPLLIISQIYESYVKCVKVKQM